MRCSVRLHAPLGARAKVFAALLVLSCASRTWGQGTQGEHTLKRGDNELGVIGGTSVNTPTLIGTVEDSRLTFAAFRYGRVIGTRGPVAFEYTVDFVPLALVSRPEFVFTQEPGSNRFTVRTTHRTVYGAGPSPVGFKFNFRREKRVQPFASTSGGILYFSKQVPLAGSSQFNFTFEFSGGVQFFTHSRRAVTLGYRLQHVSNGNTAEFNPGLDANVIYGGFSVFR